MAAPTLEDIQQDALAVSVARAVAVANGTAIAQGVDLSASLINILEETGPPQRVWRIHYGSRDYVHRRGGDLIVLVDDGAGAVRQILRGQ